MDLPSVLGGLAQGFKDFGTSVVDLFGTGGAAIGDLLQGTGTRNQDDFRKWLYNTNSVQDAAAKGLGTALNGVQTVSDYIPGIGAVTRNPLFNAAQGALGGLADEFKMNGENYDLGRAGQRAAVSGAAALAGSSLGDALKKSANPLLQSGLAQGLARGAAGGAINQGGYAAIDGGDIMQSALQGAGMGALLGGATGAMQDFRPRKLTPAEMAFTDEEKAARIANIDDQLSKLDTTTPEGNARYNELMQAREKYSGTKRLYRGLSQEYDPNYPTNKLDTSGYESWTDNPELARQYGKNVYYTDVPESDIKTSYMDENPQSETYGDRNLWHSITKPAGLNGVSGTEYLLYMDDPASRSLVRNRLQGGATAQPDYLGDEKYSELVKKAKNYKTLDRFEKMNNPIKGSEIWGEKPKSYFERDSRAVRINMFPNDAAKGTGLTKQYLLNMFKDAYDEGITDIVPSYGSYTKDGASFMDHLAEQGWVKQKGRNGYNSYEIAPKIAEWQKTNPLADIYNAANNAAPKALETTLADSDMAVNSPKLTPEQEAYFKDSVIRDENGNLIPLYHGSNSKFTVFDSSKGGQSNKTAKVGHWFTPSEEGARNFANSVWYGDESEPTVYSTYLNVKNPKVYEAVDNSAQIKALNDEMDGLQRQLDGMRRGSDDFNATYKKYNDLAKQIDNLSYGDPYEQFRSDIYAMEGKTPYQANVGGLGMMMDDENAATQKYVQSLRDQGYDGIIIRGTNYDNGTLGGVNDQYVVFDSNQIKDINNLKPTSDVDIMASRMTPDEIDLARALAGQDMAVNSAKVAPGQLGLFDDLPTQTPKTGTRQVSIFDQPQEGLDYYGEDIEMPISENGLISRNVEDLTQVPIDESTLPKGWGKARELLSQGKKARDIMLDKNDLQSALNAALYSESQYGYNTPVADIIDRLGPRQLANEIDRGAARLLTDQLAESGDDFARKVVTGASEVGGNIGHYKDAPKAKLADQRVSEILNIGRSNSMLSDSLAKPTSKTALGDHWKGTINIKGNDLSYGGDDASSVLWHERMHAFQDAENMGYDKRVVDAYKELRKDLAELQHDKKQILQDHGSDAKYWGKPIEQEARMAQHYLDSNYGVENLSKIYARDGRGKIIMVDEMGEKINPDSLNYYRGKPVKRSEYDAETPQITAAFDKFIGKLQKLSKQGVALPAMATLFGGVTLQQLLDAKDSDKDKKKIKRSA